MAWVKTVPTTLGNPLYHWSHLELRRYFGIEETINEKNGPVIWEKANKILQSEGFSVRQLIRDQQVRVICTTDDPTDTLEYHEGIKGLSDFDCLVLPSFRPDKGLEIRRATFIPWVRKLEEAAGLPIDSYERFLAAIDSRIEHFAKVGCKVSDHALDQVYYADVTLEEASAIFAKALDGQALTLEEEQKHKTYTLIHLGEQYSKRGWTMQLHMHASRNNNGRMFDRIGPDTGYDSIHDGQLAYPLMKLLDAIEGRISLPQTILYSLNPKDYYVLGT